MGAFEPGAALGAGATAGMLAVTLVYTLIGVHPRVMRLDPLLTLGGVLGFAGASAYLVGALAYLPGAALLGTAYGSLLSAAGVHEAWLAWGVLAGLAHAVAGGLVLALVPSLDEGALPAPGPFALNLSRSSAAVVVGAHVVFGLVTTVTYAHWA